MKSSVITFPGSNCDRDMDVVLTPVRKMSIAEQLSMLNTDEALEITPNSCRLRKAILDPHERKRSEKSGAAA